MRGLPDYVMDLRNGIESPKWIPRINDPWVKWTKAHLMSLDLETLWFKSLVSEAYRSGVS